MECFFFVVMIMISGFCFFRLFWLSVCRVVVNWLILNEKFVVGMVCLVKWDIRLL